MAGIEPSNSVVSGQPRPAAEEAQTGLTARNQNQAKAESGKHSDSVQVSEQARLLQSALEAAHKSAGKEAVVDMERVNTLKERIKKGELDTLKGMEQKLASAEKIANRMLEIDQQLPVAKLSDEA